ncbi:MAG: cholest-4-en-3-one 26-monooxygenase [Frankiales bacterium]|jgi:cholest-4-en-3-one 26-monooxygenase|nr:cholest-4-en-3-one 26-monooxygenase [Frankiales bacterium]
MSLDDIDLYTLDQYERELPLDQLKRLRNEAPVFKHDDPEKPDGFWALTRHADVEFVSRNADMFSSYEQSALISEFPQDQLDQLRLLMLNQDPPQHTRTRSLVNRGFTPRMISNLEERIAGVCEQIVDHAVEQGEGDFVALCAAELPLIVIAELMGVPQEDRHKVFDWSNRMVGANDPEYGVTQEEARDASIEMFMYANALAEEKRKQPKDDIVTKLLTPDEEGQALTELEFDSFFMLLAVAGNETTRNALTGGMYAFIQNPDQWDKLKADHSLIPTAADEIVRYVSPVMHFRRTATRDIEIGGVQINKDDKVVIYYNSANRDELVFENPDDFDITRDPNPHLGFGGGGPHFCLGRHLAKLEIEQMLQALLDRVDRVEMVSPPRRLRSNFINGIKEMQVRFIPLSSTA